MATPETILSLNSLEANDAPAAENILTATGALDRSKERTELRLPNGSVVHLATALLLDSTRKAAVSASPLLEPSGQSMVPIVEERLQVGKQTVPTGRVVLEKKIHEYEETLDVPLAARNFEIERVVLNQPVDQAPAIRQEGATTIYPLVEERLIITTQLILKEELRVTQRDTERRDTRTVTLKRETIDVTRTPLT